MAMLDRYKKKGGFVQLLQLIESSGKTKQEQFLALIAAESPAWEEAIRKKSLTLDKILSWNQVYLGEVLTRVQPLTLATAFNGMPKENVERILSCIGISDRRKIQQVIDESNPTPAEISTCIMKIIMETRSMIQSGILKMDKIDPEMMIADHFEEHLNKVHLQRAIEGSGLTVTNPVTEGSGEPSPLNFDGPKAAPASESSGRYSEEIEFLKKKVHQLVAENASLKQEIAVMRGKLDQIRKIA